MSDNNIEHNYETRASFRKLLSAIEADNAASLESLIRLSPPRPGSRDPEDDNSACGDEDSFIKDTAAFSWSIPTPSTPLSLINSTSPSPPLPTSRSEVDPSTRSSKSKAQPETISSTPISMTLARQPFRETTTPLVASSLGQIKMTDQERSSKTGGKKGVQDETTLVSDDALGPFAHELERSTRERLRRQASDLRDESGKLCPLQMARLFWANSTLGMPHWPELDEGERTINKMRKDSFDFQHLRDLQEREDFEKREKEKRRLGNKRRYGLIDEDKIPRTTEIQHGKIKKNGPPTSQ